MICIHDLSAVEELRRRLRLDSHRLRQFRTAFYKKQSSTEASLEKLPEAAREAFARELSFHSLALASRHDSSLDGASKLIFRTAAGLLLESVVLRMTSGRTALCISTQVGCAAHCDFCATGKMGIARDLSAAEMLDQLVQANQLLAQEHRSVRNLVFMGMGEPFHNCQQLWHALALLSDSRLFNLNLKRVLISTVGIPERMVECARRFPDVRLALSLHSARQEVRQKIMPIAVRHTLADLREALLEVSTLNGHLVMIEYLMLAEVNDADEDAQALIDYVRDIPVHINLIPYNPIDDAPHLAGSDCSRREAFAARLKSAGLPVTTRYSLGKDIAAACGQLVRQEHRTQLQSARTQLASASLDAT